MGIRTTIPDWRPINYQLYGKNYFNKIMNFKMEVFLLIFDITAFHVRSLKSVNIPVSSAMENLIISAIKIMNLVVSQI